MHLIGCQAWTMLVPRYLDLSNACRLTYHSTEGTESPGVVCCNGFRSEMSGRKALALEQHCQKVKRSFVRFDYRGHSESSGDFLEFTLTDWIQDTLDILDNLTSGPQILMGSSMGAWIAVHVAIERPDRVVGIVGVASAPDFTRDIWNELSVENKEKLQENGVYYRPSFYSDEPYPITMKLLEDAHRWFLLDKASIPVTCPVYLLHGQKDGERPWQQSMALAERLQNCSVTVTLIENGNHRLSESSDLFCIISAVEAIALQYTAGPKTC